MSQNDLKNGNSDQRGKAIQLQLPYNRNRLGENLVESRRSTSSLVPIVSAA